MFWQRKRLAEFPAAASGSRPVMLKNVREACAKSKTWSGNGAAIGSR